MTSVWRALLAGALLLSACNEPQILKLAGPGGQAAMERIFLVTNRVLSSDPEDRKARAETVSRAVLDVGLPFLPPICRAPSNTWRAI